MSLYYITCEYLLFIIKICTTPKRHLRSLSTIILNVYNIFKLADLLVYVFIVKCTLFAICCIT